jgi:hypothetical protein
VIDLSSVVVTWNARKLVFECLARLSHHASTAAAHLRTPARDLGLRVLDVPTGTPPGGALRKENEYPEISRESTNLHALATRRGEKSGLASVEREDPALTGIEYHCSLYRFFRKNRGRSRMAIVFVLRITKSLFYVVSQALLARLDERQRARWVVHRDVLLWHRWGRRASVGLARVRAEARR